MPKNDDGEFELILGNRQLMAVFFIVVILLAVFFALGYIIGRPSNQVGVAEVATSHPLETKPVPKVDTTSTTRDTATSTPTDAPVDSPPAPKETASQQGPATKPAPPPDPAPAPPPAKASSRTATSDEPQSGTYLQLSAIDHDKAEIMVELLRKKKFSAIAAEIPEKPGVFRVLVGPMSESDVNKMRADLQSASFPGKEAVKRKI